MGEGKGEGERIEGEEVEEYRVERPGEKVVGFRRKRFVEAGEGWLRRTGSVGVAGRGERLTQ